MSLSHKNMTINYYIINALTKLFTNNPRPDSIPYSTTSGSQRVNFVS